MVAELYGNFDVPGIIVGMMVMGFYMRSLYLRMGINGGANPVRLAIYVTLLYTAVPDAEGTISGLQGMLVKETLILLAIEKLLMIVSGRIRRRGELQSAHAIPARIAAL